MRATGPLHDDEVDGWIMQLRQGVDALKRSSGAPGSQHGGNGLAYLHFLISRAWLPRT